MLKVEYRETLMWRHNELDGVSNHRRIDCLLNRLFRRRSEKTSKLHTTVRENHQWLVNSPHKGPVTWNIFPFDDVIMKYTIQADVLSACTAETSTAIISSVSYCLLLGRISTIFAISALSKTANILMNYPARVWLSCCGEGLVTPQRLYWYYRSTD